MSRSVYVYAVLCIVAFVGAYLSWTHEPESSVASGVTIAPIAADALTQVVYENDEHSVVLEPREDDTGHYVWMTWEAREAGAKHEGEQNHESVDKPTKVKTARKQGAGKAGEVAEDIVEKLAPIEAARKLETNATDMAQFGLKEPEATLTVHLATGDQYTLEVGHRTYGGRHYYVRERQSGDIYLLDSGRISPLDAPSRLEGRDLHGLQRRDIARVQLQYGAETVVLEQRHRSDRAASFWAMGGQDSASKVAETWLDKFFRLYATEYVSPPPEGLETAFAARLKPDGGKVVTVEVLRAPGTDDEEDRFFAKSNFTRGVVELPKRSASNVVDDLSTLFAGSSKL